MTMKRAILEMGMGNDLHGEDYTKAAERAIKDALHHSSLSFIRTLNIDKNQLFVNVTIGVQKPENVNTKELKKLLPVGVVSGYGAFSLMVTLIWLYLEILRLLAKMRSR